MAENLHTEITGDSSSAQRAFGGLGDVIRTGLGTALGFMTAQAIPALIGKVGEALGSFSNWANQLDGMGDVLGTSSEESAALAVAIQGVGGNVDAITGQLAKMSSGLVSANGEMGPTGEILTSMGIAFQDANGNMLPTTEILTSIADQIALMPDGLEKTTLMTDLFGKSGKDLTDTMSALANGGLAAADEKAKALGLSLGDELTGKSVEVGKQMETVKMAIQGVFVSIGAELLPILAPLLAQFSTWAVSIMPPVRAALEVLGNWLGVLIPAAIQVLSTFWLTVLQPAIQTVWGWLETVLMPFFTNTLVPWLQVFIPAALQVLSDFWSNILKPAVEFAWTFIKDFVIPFFQATVIPILQVAIPAALQVLSDFWTNVLQPAIAQVWEWMNGTLMPFLTGTVVPWLEVTIPAALQTLSDYWTGTLQPAIEAVWEFLTVDMLPIWESLRTLLEVTVVAAITALVVIWDTVLQPALEDLWEIIKNDVVPMLETFWGWLGDITGGIDGISNAIDTVIGWIQDFIEWLSKVDDNLPPWLVPGSPTPLEMGLRGIGSALSDLNRSALLEFNANLRMMGGGSSLAGRGANNYNLTIYSNSPTEPLLSDFDSLRALAASF